MKIIYITTDSISVILLEILLSLYGMVMGLTDKKQQKK